MDMLAILEISIGTVMVYLVLSLVCTALLETLIGATGVKHENLRKSVERLLGSKALAEELYRDPEIVVLCGANGRKPSYIPTDVFARSVLNLATDEKWRASGGVPSIVRDACIDFGNAISEGTDEHKAARKQLSQTLVRFIDEAAGDLDVLMNKIELWFDRTCDRSKGWFKRKINRWLIVIGLIVAALVNADTIQIFQRLSADPQLRAAAVELATDKLKEEDIIDDGIESDAPVLELVREQVGEVAPFVGWSDQDPFVLAWSDEEKSTLVAFVKKSIGLLLTAFAISLGAPFWFDLLQKLVNVRQSVVAEKPTDKSKAETTRDAKDADSGQDSGEVLSPASKPTGPMGGFNPIASSVNLENAYWLARAADLAYETDTGKLRSTIESWGLKVQVFESQDPQVRQFWKGKLATVDTQGFIAANENLILVCFRGTEPTRPADILTDLQFKSEAAGPYGSGEVHRGFKAAIESVWSDVTSQIDSMGGNQQPVWFAGHSLGGALAVLAASRYEKESREANLLARSEIARIEEQLTAAPENDELIGKRAKALAALRGRAAGVYTIGQPRVGNDEFAKDVDARMGRSHVRVINNRDIVPRVPFRAMDFEHSGAVLYIDEFGRLHTDPGLWFRLLDTVVISRSEVEKSREGVQDHSSSAYVDLLDRARADA